MLIPFGILGASGGGAAGAYELISTTLISTDTFSVTLSDIPQTYKHLQLRYVDRTGASTEASFLSARFNGDIGTNYASHALFSTPGSSSVTSAMTRSANSTNLDIGYITGAAAGSSQVQGAGVLDILDYSSTTKFKTTRSLSGGVNTNTSLYRVGITSGLWRGTQAITSITLFYDRASGEFAFQAGARLSLYGIKG